MAILSIQSKNDDTFNTDDATGANSLTGGTGNDIFYLYSNGADTLNYAAGDGVDSVYGFDSSLDLISFGGISTVNASFNGSDTELFDASNSNLLMTLYEASITAANVTGATVNFV